MPPPEAILGRLGPIIRETVLVDGRSFLIERPSESDRLLDDPAVHAAFERDEYMPYWADLWPAARMLAKVILRETWTPGQESLEIGCGLGLPGIVALAMGLKVTFSDYDTCVPCTSRPPMPGSTAWMVSARPARLAGAPPSLPTGVLLASDLVYELRNVPPLIPFIQKVLLPGGVCLLTDQDRIPSHALRHALDSERLPYSTQIVRGRRAGRPAWLEGTLYRIGRA